MIWWEQDIDNVLGRSNALWLREARPVMRKLTTDDYYNLDFCKNLNSGDDEGNDCHHKPQGIKNGSTGRKE